MEASGRIKVSCGVCGKARQAGKELAKWAMAGLPVANHLDRVKICKECEFFNRGICLKCGCVIIVKARMATTGCPLGKWPNDPAASS